MPVELKADRSLEAGYSRISSNNFNKCVYYDDELACCKRHSDWSDAMPILADCKGQCADYQEKSAAGEKIKQIHKETAIDIEKYQD